VIKEIKLKGMSEEEKKEALKEAKILKMLNHPNIIGFKRVFKSENDKLCILMEYAAGGDL
jgi:NIMA (never in mitosis gene a)-related kinase 1/4/5